MIVFEEENLQKDLVSSLCLSWVQQVSRLEYSAMGKRRVHARGRVRDGSACESGVEAYGEGRGVVQHVTYLTEGKKRFDQ